MSTKDKTRYITDASQVPEGWVPLKEVTDRSTPEGATFARKLSVAHQDGSVRAVKLVRSRGDVRVGRVWLCPDDLEDFRRQFESRRSAATPSVRQSVEGRCDDDEEGIRQELRRLTATVSDLQAAIELYVFSK